MPERAISPLSDIFLIWTAIVAALAAQFILVLLGIGVGILTSATPAAPGSRAAAWFAFVWWAASGVFAAGLAGSVIAALGEGIDDAKRIVLALVAWATALLIATLVAAVSGAAGASVLSFLGGPLAATLDQAAQGQLTPELQRQASAFAMSAVVATLLGAAAAIAGAIYAPETRVRAAKRG
jgi:hypothetical protein